jgi:NADH dehydrogenase (ubiquinone) Fe-S protein 3
MLFKKYQFPINIFIVFEKINPVLYTSQVLTPNHYVCFINSKWYYGINIFLKKELFFNFSNLIDMSCIDTLKYNKFIPDFDLINNKRFILYNIYYMYWIKVRLTLVQFSETNVDSIDLVYRNSSWLEREVSEMYGVKYKNKHDNRSLLLDYSRNEYPMLKDFPTEGYHEIYFDFFENKLQYVKNEFVEL